MRAFLWLAVLALASLGAQAQEREWSFETSADEAFLIFGVPESEDVGISLWCKSGSGEIRIFVPDAGPLPSGKTAKLQIVVAEKTFDYDAEPMRNEESGSMSAEVTTRPADPLYTALRDGDHFTIKIDSEEIAFPLTGADIDGLLRVCS